MIISDLKIRMLIPILLFSFMVCSAKSNLKNQPMEIQVTTTKTTNIIFEYSILSIDRGSEFLSAQRASGIRNIIQVRAGVADLEPTNLTVITSDGKLHSLLIRYHPNSDKLVYHIGGTNPWAAQFEEGYHNEKKLQLGVKRSLAKMNYESIEKQRRMGITFSLEVIYATEHFLWFRFIISNHTKVKLYDRRHSVLYSRY